MNDQEFDQLLSKLNKLTDDQLETLSSIVQEEEHDRFKEDEEDDCESIHAHHQSSWLRINPPRF